MGRSSHTQARDRAATGVRYLVLAGLCTINLIAYVHRNSLVAAEKTMREDIGLSKDEMGWVLSAFFLTYAAAQIPSGWLGHVWGTRRTLPLCAVLGAAALSLLALARSFPALLVARLGLGVAQAGMLPCSTTALGRWLPATRRALASSALGASLSVGGALGAAITGVLLEPVGWRWLFGIYALPSLVWAVWFFAWYRDRPQDHPAVNAAERELLGATADPLGHRPEPTPWRILFTSPAMSWICGQQFFRAAGYMFYASWFATYLQEARGVSVAAAGLLTSLPLIGVVVGSPVGGLASDWILTRTGSRRLGRQGVAIASTLLGALFILLARPVADARIAVALIAAGACCAAFAGPCAYAISIDMGGRHVAPVFSTMNMAGNVGAMVFPIVVPRLVAGGNWDRVLLVFAGLHLAAAVCWLGLNPRGTIFDRAAAEPSRT
jgi:ACS family glucarate transporter-like MFS transporter